MSSIIGLLISQSPFSCLEEMMKEINFVVSKIPKLFTLLESNESDDDLEKLFNLISDNERKIDNIKKNIRKAISKVIFLPISKRDFIDIVLSLDEIPDSTKSLASLFLLRKLNYPETFKDNIEKIIKSIQNINTLLSDIIFNEIPNLMSTSFKGPDAMAVIEMIDDISVYAYDVENLVHDTLKDVFIYENTFHSSEVLLWTRILRKLEAIAHYQEKTGNVFRRILE